MDHQMDGQSSTTSGVAPASMAPPNTSNSNVKVAAGYVLQERLGSGSFATVYKGIRLAEYQQSISISSGSQAPPPAEAISAIKAISRSSKKLTKKVLENLDMEIAILRTYRHPNIVCLHEVQKTDRHFYLVLEYCGGGDLQKLIRTRQKSRLSERLCRRLLRDLTAGLGFLWGKELVHRDIKPQNLLLTASLPQEDEADNPPREDAARALQGMTQGDRFMLKIADFGFARHLSGVDLAETMCGSPLYMAPEILSGEKYDAKADLWSVGAVLFEMVSGKTPFHGENHLDLLRNIKTKAVRLPASVRLSKEFITLLKLLLDRKPHNRADFRAFFEASEACVALGCNGTPAVPASANLQATVAENNATEMMPMNSGQKIMDREVISQMNLCAISENEGTDPSASLATVATLGTVNHQQLQQYRAPHPAQQGGNFVSNIGASQTNNINAMVQVRPDHVNIHGVVTPPFNPISAPHQAPPALPTSVAPGAAMQQNRPSVFTPLQASPVYPRATPAVPSPPLLSLGGDTNAYPPPRPGPGPINYHSQGSGTYPPMHQQQMIHQQQMVGHPTQAYTQNNPLAMNRMNSSPNASNHGSNSSDSEFVMVEHVGYRSRPTSGQNSPATSQFGGQGYSPSVSPHNSQGRVTILDARNNMGMLGTSPGTGRALVGRMMMGSSPSKSSSLTPPSSSGGGRFNLSPRSALRSGGCLAHIDALARMLATAEDVGRRAITVSHLGDVRAYMAMELLIVQTQREESNQVSSMSTGTPMEGVDEQRRRLSAKAANEDDDEDELPFAMTSSNDGVTSSSPPNETMSKVAQASANAKSSDSLTPKDEASSEINLRFREALMCYFKTLSMMKGSISAAQKVMKDVNDVMNAGPSSANNKNPYEPLKERCSASLDWLQGQFTAVLERADAASDQISKLQKANPSQEEAPVSVEVLIYNHSLKCGREGAVKQINRQYDKARSCYRTAGLLAETLLMESKVVEEDRKVLDYYINTFAEQILELDGLMRVEMRRSRAAIEQGQTTGGSVSSGTGR